ncbi:MAG: DUF465 domain-containing protein [Parvularculales bacterium]
MTVMDHINKLIERHRKIESDITLENQRPNPDQIKLSEMKRQKLQIKEEIERLKITPDNARDINAV